MKVKQKLAHRALLVAALFAILSPLGTAYIALRPSTAAAAGNPTAAIVPDQYSPIDNQVQNTNPPHSAYQCTAALHAPADLGDDNAGNTNGGSAAAWLAITAVQTGYGPGVVNNQFKVISNMLSNVQGTNGSFQPTFDDTGLKSKKVLYIDFQGLNSGNADNNQKCQTALWLFREPTSATGTQFFGFWNTGQYRSPSDLQSDLSKNLVAITANINVTNKTVDFTIPGGYSRSGSFSMSLNDPDSVIGNAAYFPPSSGGGSTTAGTNCLESSTDNGQLSNCLTNVLGNPVAQFSNATTILFAGDIYTAQTWGGDTMTYTITTPVDGTRLNGGHPITLTMHTDTANTDINMDDKGSLNEINQIAWALNHPGIVGLTFDNYDVAGNHSSATIKANTANINEWATYYKQDDAVALMFQQAGSNEQPYFGTYTRVKGTNDFSLASSNWGGACTKNFPTFSFTSDPANAPVIHEDGVDQAQSLPATWKPTAHDGVCTFGNVPVIVTMALTGSVPSIGSGNTNTSDSGPQIDCHVSLFNPLSWFLCPLATALETVVSGLDDEINNFMNIKPGQGSYDITKCTPGDQWCYYYAPWSVMRDIALALAVVFALVAIVSQAFGFEIFDAYTLRKVLPRLLIAIIGITLSWPLMMFFINLIDGIGLSIRGLIYHPFAKDFGTVALGGGGQFIASLFVAGAIGALGFAGLLSFVATAALATSLAFLVLTLRQMVITMLVIFAPVAIVCYILPNTQKAWKLWWDSFSRGLLMFPLIAAFIAIGRVFAAVNSKNTGSINQIIAFTAYFAPYFLIPFTFRLAGGAIATLGGLVNDRGRGAFDRLKKYRGTKTAQNLHDMATGNRAKGDNAFSNAFNASTRNAANLRNAGFTPWKMRSRMQGAAAAHGLGELGEYMEKNSAFAAIKGNDDYLQATMSNMGGGNTEAHWRKYLSDHGYQGRSLEQGVAAIRAAKRGVSNEIFERAAVVANAATGTGWKEGGPAQMLESINNVTHGDRQTATSMLAQMRSMAGQSGRLDIAGSGFGAISTAMEAMNNGTMTHEQANSSVMQNGIYTKGAGEYARARGQAVKNIAPEMLKRLQHAHSGVEIAERSGNAQAIEVAKRNLGQEYAALDNLHDSLNHMAPENAQIIADSVLNQKLNPADPASITVAQNLELLKKNKDAQGIAYQQTRHNFGQQEDAAGRSRPPEPPEGG